MSKSEINVTPLIDVLLVLLIIFMVVTPTQSVGLEAAVPQPQPAATAADRRTVVIQIDANLGICINSEQSTMDQLGSRLSEIFRSRAERVVFVQASPDIEFQHVARILDIAKGAGIDQFGLLKFPG